jgi:hypothetical protein
MVHASGAPYIACRFPGRQARRCMRRAARRGSAAPLHLRRSSALVLLAPSVAMSTARTFIALFFICHPLPQFVRSGVGVILTSPSCLVEGVRSGSRRRNAATPSVLAGGGAGLGSRPAAPAWAVTALCSRYVGDAVNMRGGRAEPGIAQRAFRHGHST